jgi:diacylglycerol kinase (ATP)
MRFALIYNPRSGRRHDLRESIIRSAADILRTKCEVSLFATTCAGDATAKAHQAIALGHECIIAAGGDGTAHEILQAMVESRSSASLGVLPLGTGNVLATDIGLPRDPLTATRALLEFEPQRISAGKIEYFDPASQRTVSRFFTVAAGVGAHARLIYDASAAAKRHGGLATYYYTGFRSLFSHKFVPMHARITTAEGFVSTREVVEVVAMRVSSFGGLLKKWRPGGALRSNELRLVLLTRANRLALFGYSLAAFAGRTDERAGIEFASAVRVECGALDGPVHVQADGEVLGTSPVTITIVPDAFNLLMPVPSRFPISR